jgi:GAF domain-containing protein
MYTQLIKDISNYLDKKPEPKEALNWICKQIREKLPKYDWVGFYFHHDDKNELHLKSFAGKPTNHTVIPYGKGICGQVAVSSESFLVNNVSEHDNYIACNINVKSEIVVPIFLNNKNIGQIDIDSNSPYAFNQEDEVFLVRINSLISSLLLGSSINL